MSVEFSGVSHGWRTQDEIHKEVGEPGQNKYFIYGTSPGQLQSLESDDRRVRDYAAAAMNQKPQMDNWAWEIAVTLRKITATRCLGKSMQDTVDYLMAKIPKHIFRAIRTDVDPTMTSSRDG